MAIESIGRYQILGTLGEGGQAVVYRAYDPNVQREVAVKVLLSAMEGHFRSRFEREVHIIASLEHPAIVPVYDFGEFEGRLFLVMRLMKGGTLRDRLAKGTIAPEEALSILRPIASALDAAHARGIIHRDIKPANILFDEYGNSYLSDFGIARVQDATATLTGSQILGTPYYMSPEQVMGEKNIDGRSDVYSLGALLFQMLTGHHPYEGETPAQVLMQHLNSPTPQLADYRADLPEAFQKIVSRAMAKEPAERYPTAGALVQDLQNAIEGKPIANPTGETLVANIPTSATEVMQEETADKAKTAVASPPRKPSAVWKIIGGVAALAFIGAAAFFAFGNRASPSPTLTAVPTATRVPVVAAPTQAPSPTPSPIPTKRPTPTKTKPPTATAQPTTALPSPTPKAAFGGAPLGGADLIAFVSNGDIWFVNPDGSGLRRVTRDGGGKHGLQWVSRNELIYISGKCVFSLTLNPIKTRPLVCYPTAKSLDAFRVSPDKSKVAIVLDNELYIVPYKPRILAHSRTKEELMNVPGYCGRFIQDKVHEILWGKNGKFIAARVTVPVDGRPGDQIEILNPVCGEAIYRHHIFPGHRFPLTTYAQIPRIASFDWDGDKLFVFNLYWRNGCFGDMYFYSRETYTGERLKPVTNDRCCYASPRWSPDGSYLLFFFQGIDDPRGKIYLYYIPFGTIGSGMNYKPLPLTKPVFTSQRDVLEAALRPAP